MCKHAEFAVTPLFHHLPHELGEGDFKAVSDKLFSVLFFVTLYLIHTCLFILKFFFNKTSALCSMKCSLSLVFHFCTVFVFVV